MAALRSAPHPFPTLCGRWCPPWPRARIVGAHLILALVLAACGTGTPARDASPPHGALAGSTDAPTTPGRPALDGLAPTIAGLAQGRRVGVALVELGSGERWSWHGGDAFVAASTYKLPALMLDAQRIADGSARPDDVLCFQPDDYEVGWFDDYAATPCHTRAELDERAGRYSDNTAGHILVRTDGGPDVLNSYARRMGASESAFFEPNTTTASDLAALLVAEADGPAGGPAAQTYLYPLLTHTEFEQGVPAGVPADVPVVHKVGELDAVNDDAALVEGPRPYVLAVCTADGGMELVAAISAAVWQMEEARA